MWYGEYGFKKIPFGWATRVTPRGWRHGYRSAPRAGDRAAPASANIFNSTAKLLLIFLRIYYHLLDVVQRWL